MSGVRIGWRRTAAAAVAACLAIGGVAGAQAQEANWYIGASVPIMFIDDSEASSTGSFTQVDPRTRQPVTTDYRATVESEHDTGFKIGGMVGYEFGDGLRVEGELFLARAKVSKLTHSRIAVPAHNLILEDELSIPVSGSAEQLGAMVNLWYDVDIGADAWTPYIGGGLGFIRIDQGDVHYDTGAVAGAVACEAALLAARAQHPQATRQQACAQLPALDVPELSGTDTAFAYQIGAGVGYGLSDTTTLQLGYRMQTMNGLEFSGRNATASVHAETDLLVHFFEIGIRQRF